MTAIAGICSPGKRLEVERMLACLAHRGAGEKIITELNGVTLGAAPSTAQNYPLRSSNDKLQVQDYVGWSHYARVDLISKDIALERDPFGLAPLYYGWTPDMELCFASEMKALLPLTRTIFLLPPGSVFNGKKVVRYFALKKQAEISDPPEVIAAELRSRLQTAVVRCIGNGNEEVGSWLSGGLDSSAIAALARPNVDRLHTFAAGLPGAPDLHYARDVASFIHAEHHEVIFDFAKMLAVLPQVIYHLESFDPLLVRSSISNFLVAQRAAEYVPAVFSGEGGDELFAGYEYLKSIDSSLLPDELIDITNRLHNTALQRVDRSASAHGQIAYVVFLDPEVVDFAVRIPAAYKIKDGVEKWILRQALQGLLPEPVLARKKAKFWEGAGVQSLMADYANQKVSDADFQRECILPNGWRLATKEELFYYRIFQEQFGAIEYLDWMGRTKSQPN